MFKICWFVPLIKKSIHNPPSFFRLCQVTITNTSVFVMHIVRVR